MRTVIFWISLKLLFRNIQRKTKIKHTQIVMHSENPTGSKQNKQT